MAVIIRVIGKLSIKKSMADLLVIYMWSKDFCLGCQNLVRTLDKMNNSRPIIKIFLFPYTERTERIFSSNFANFFILPAYENARYAKMVWLENLHADRITVCFEPWQKLKARLGARKTGLSPPVFLYWPFQGGTSVVVPYCSCCLCLYFDSSITLVTYFVNFR